MADENDTSDEIDTSPEAIAATVFGLQVMLEQYANTQSFEGFPTALRNGIAAIETLAAERDALAARLERIGASRKVWIGRAKAAEAVRDDAVEILSEPVSGLLGVKWLRRRLAFISEHGGAA